MSTLLLIIDMQNDFCRPDGALYVQGAEKDVARLGKFIAANSEKIDQIIMTQDNHHVIDISHPEFWEDNKGNPPAPCTVINTEDVRRGVWRPRFKKEEAIDYIHNLEKQGEFPHVIWPEHCIIGSYGAAIADEIMHPVKAWARKGRFFNVQIKGTNPLTEHFGALKANIPIKDSPETQLNTDLVKELKHFDIILIAGEAKSHCVAATVKQMLDIRGIVKKLFILEDCMSDVKGFETIALPIYEKAKANGARFILSTEWSWPTSV
jgi:nicotinamidase/pyrazinamidase